MSEVQVAAPEDRRELEQHRAALGPRRRVRRVQLARIAQRELARARLVVRHRRRRQAPVLVVSHAPPRGVGDAAADRYHLGFAGYRWLLERVRPPLWLHGHTTLASVADWRASLGPSTVANVSGSILVELQPPAAASS